MEDVNLALDIENLSVVYETDSEKVYAVNDLSLKLAKGGALGIVGETGAGKTTTALSIMRLLPDKVGKVVNGTIMVNNSNVLALSDAEMRRLRGNLISMIFQDPMTSLNPVMRVGEQIAECFIKHRGLSKKEAKKEAERMLELVGISASRGQDFPHEFSGGMKQRVLIAIALACDPQLLIADEPTTALDVTIQAQVLELIKRLMQEYETSLVLITHDLGVVAEICDHVAIMYAGRVIEEGSLEDIFDYHKHPYTEGLFDSLPDLSKRNELLKPIKGSMPDPTNLPEGCAFNPRCPYAKDICSQKLPSLTRVSETQCVACHMFDEQNKQSWQAKLRNE